MEEADVIRLISQYLSDHNFQLTLESLEKESGRKYKPIMDKKNGELQEILDDHVVKVRFQEHAASSVTDLFAVGDRGYVNELWTSIDYLTEGNNVLVVKLASNGSLAIGAAKSLVILTEIEVPLQLDSPPHSVLSSTHVLSKGGILAMDYHPIHKHLLLCSTMDRMSFIMDTEKSLKDELTIIQKFNDHSKYVTRAVWSRTGEYFITGSYDQTVTLYRKDSTTDMYAKVDFRDFKGTVEALAISKLTDTIIVGVRRDNLLHCIDFSSGSFEEIRQINMNVLGDDYVSFTAMHCSFSPDEKFVLVSTDQDRLVLYNYETGKLITTFYGATNNEYSQPRHCWDPKGLYIYGTSQDKTICVWEIRTQKIVTKLQSHSGIVRDLYFCDELGLLVSCGFDGAVKLWRHNPSTIVIED